MFDAKPNGPASLSDYKGPTACIDEHKNWKFRVKNNRDTKVYANRVLTDLTDDNVCFDQAAIDFFEDRAGKEDKFVMDTVAAVHYKKQE